MGLIFSPYKCKTPHETATKVCSTQNQTFGWSILLRKEKQVRKWETLANMVANYQLDLDKKNGHVWSWAGWLLHNQWAQTLPMIRSRMLVEIKSDEIEKELDWSVTDTPHIKGLWLFDCTVVVGHVITCMWHVSQCCISLWNNSCAQESAQHTVRINQ